MTMSGSSIGLSIIVPCLNEVDNVGRFIDRVAEINKSITIRYEILFVDGGSTDGTPMNIKTTAFKHKLNNLISVITAGDSGFGYGHDIIYGLSTAKYDVLAWTHADLQTDIYDVFIAFDHFISLNGMAEDIIIKGKRKSRPVIDSLFTFGMQLFSLAVTKVNLNDINAQPKLFSKRFFQLYLSIDPPCDFSLDLHALLTAKKYNFRIETIPVFFNKRRYGQPKGGGSFKVKYKLIKRTVKYIMNSRVI